MKINRRWRNLGWRHPLWDILRFYLSLPHGRPRANWLEKLQQSNSLSVEQGEEFQIDPQDVSLLTEYLQKRDEYFADAVNRLRSEEEALDFCRQHRMAVATTATQNLDHHQSSKALVSAVTEIAAELCGRSGVAMHPNPTRRCVWCMDSGLHVSARNVDGVIPSLANPTIIWEIKEYWGKTKGGSKMSDAVYECHLVGRELREYEEKSRFKVAHAVFLDGREQWGARQSDLKRFIDLTNQGLIDYLFVGKDVETEWESTLTKILPG